MPTDALGRQLVAIAREAIESSYRDIPAVSGDDPRLDAPGATFVTLTQRGRLRGCIGSLEAWRTLAEDVRENACAAAFRDPRFAPLAVDELAQTRVEVSLLTPAEAIACHDEDDALRQLRPGVDGIVLECGGRRATFLPQVWEQLPEPQRFLTQLKRKAGLPDDYWSDRLRLSRYHVQKWKEN